MDELNLTYRNNRIKSAIINNRDDLLNILKYVDKVYLYGKDEYISIFGKYIAERVNCDLNLLTDDVCIKSRDVVFILTLDENEFIKIAQWAIDKYQCSFLQLIPPSCFFTKILAEVTGTVLNVNLKEAQLPILATIDIVDNCNLSCMTCSREAFANSSGRMDIALFRRILDKLELMGIKQVELYNYTEPFLHPDLYEFAKEVKKRNLTLGISTNLSLKHIPKLRECVDLLTPGDWFVVTISGINEDIYNINHKGGNINNVLQNLKIISESEKRNLVILRLLHFDYNEGEVFEARRLAQQLGMTFQWFTATGNPFNSNTEMEKMRNTIKQGISFKSHNALFDDDMPYCKFIHSRNIVINHLGNVEQCCQKLTRPYDFGSFLEQDISVIQMKRQFSALCHGCMERYELPDDQFNVDADKVRMLMNNAMNTVGIVKKLSPVSLYKGLRKDSEYIDSVRKYYISQLINMSE